MNEPPPPLLFISHKHSDSKIADVVSNFIARSSGGHVTVFQSSSANNDAPRIARCLSKEVATACRAASALILIYTDAEKDWAYCMWEVGVALKPENNDPNETKIILFQCGSSRPPIFDDRVTVNVRNLVEIQRFANDFLTAGDFFPSYNGPITKFPPNGKPVAEAAAELYKQLNDVLPPQDEPTIEWPACPFLQFNIDLRDVSQLAALSEESGAQRIREKCLIVDSDRYAEQLFQVPNFLSDMTFQKLVDRWENRHGDSDWAKALALQILDAAMWEFPRSLWEYMKGPDNKFYAPVLTRVRKMPAKGCMQFDVYFDKFEATLENNKVIPKLNKSVSLKSVQKS